LGDVEVTRQYLKQQKLNFTSDRTNDEGLRKEMDECCKLIEVIMQKMEEMEEKEMLEMEVFDLKRQIDGKDAEINELKEALEETLKENQMLYYFKERLE
jgi:predicted RNase H-like nuclease (RuvC/YqgF family)